MAESNDPRHKRRSVRMPLFDYALPGTYFVTICAFRRRCLFGSILHGETQLTPLGRTITEEWLRTAELRPFVSLDSWVVMPSHFHGIIQLSQHKPLTSPLPQAPREVRSASADRAQHHSQPANLRQFGKPTSNSLPAIIGAFNSAVTRRAKSTPEHCAEAIWQRGYFEHVIRDEAGLARARDYIANNPIRWEVDREHPDRRRADS